MRKLDRAWSPVALAVAVLAIAACHTARGVGEDVSATGRAVSGTADRATPR
jgi:predicted small secreted protein